MARLKETYRAELAPRLMKDLQLKNVMEVPRVEKVTINMGLGEAIQNIKVLESAVEELGKITGQKAVITKAKNSIASFKLREGMPIGCMVTLRRNRAYEFLDRLINVALPRVRDFKGISPKAFDGRGIICVVADGLRAFEHDGIDGAYGAGRGIDLRQKLDHRFLVRNGDA